jgi:hypothetical protein
LIATAVQFYCHHIAAAAAFASVVVTVAMFLLSSLSSLFLYRYCQPCHSCSFFIHCLSFCCSWYPFSMIAVAHVVAAIVVFHDKNSKQNASKEEHQTQGPTSPSRGGCNGSCKRTCRAGRALSVPNFTEEEDYVLCVAYVNVSQNPIKGTDQTSADFWRKGALQFCLPLQLQWQWARGCRRNLYLYLFER